MSFANKKTLVIGASENPARYSYKAVRMLLDFGHEVYPLGKRTGTIFGLSIHNGWPENDAIHSVTLYINPARQTDEVMDKIISLKPNRVIFNPGTENPLFFKRLKSEQIEVIQDCTLVMLQGNRY